MAQETLGLTAVSTPDNWTLGAGASKVAAVASPDDGDTSYISAAVNNTEEKYQVAAPSVITANDAINFVRVVTVARSTSTLASFRAGVAVGANTTLGTTHANVPISYTQLTDDFTLAPDGAGWTLTKLQSLFARLVMAANRDMRATTCYVVVDYTAGQNVSASESGAGTVTVSASASLPVNESGAGSDALSVSASVSLGEGLPTESVSVSASVSVSESGAGVDATSVEALASVSEQGAGVETQSVGAQVSASETGAGADAIDVQPSVFGSEQGCGSEGFAAVAEMLVAEEGAGLEAFAVMPLIVVGEAGAGVEAVSVAIHTFTIHGNTHATLPSPNVTVGLLESSGRTSAEVR